MIKILLNLVLLTQVSECPAIKLQKHLIFLEFSKRVRMTKQLVWDLDFVWFQNLLTKLVLKNQLKLLANWKMGQQFHLV